MEHGRKLFEAIVDDRIPGLSFITRNPQPEDRRISIELRPVVQIRREQQPKVVVVNELTNNFRGSRLFSDDCFFCSNRTGIERGNRQCVSCKWASIDGNPTT